MSPVRSDLEDFAPIVDATRRGAHRSRPSLASELLPIASVVVVIAIVTAVVLTVLGGGGKDSGGDDNAAGGPSTSASSTPQSSSQPSPSPSSTPQASQTPDSSQPAADGLDKAVKYTVLNDTMTSGLAKKAATALAGAGWTATATTGNTSPKGSYTASVVYYKTDADEANAQQIASDLGIEKVTKSATKSKSTPVTVILAKDYKG